jgi:membrane associated rhomboid family serine protease
MYQDRPYASLPPLTNGVRLLLLINVAVFVVNMLVVGRLGVWLSISWQQATEAYGLGASRLLTYQFVHDFLDPLHLLFNLLLLYFFGTMIEPEIGRRRLLRLYVLAGVAGGIVQVLLGLVLERDRPTIGASGAVYGIMTWAAVVHPRATVILLLFPIRLGVLVSILVAIGVYMTYVELTTGAVTGTAHGGHVGGAACGFVACHLARRGFDPWARLDAWSAGRARRRESRRRERMDELLDKVHRQGIGSLSRGERRFLQRASEAMRRR